MIVKKFLSSVLVFVLAFASVVSSFCFAQDTAANDVNKTVEEKIEKIVSKHFEEKYANFEEFQRDFWTHIEQALNEVDENKCVSMKNAMTEMEAKYGIHKKI